MDSVTSRIVVWREADLESVISIPSNRSFFFMDLFSSCEADFNLDLVLSLDFIGSSNRNPSSFTMLSSLDPFLGRRTVGASKGKFELSLDALLVNGARFDRVGELCIVVGGPEFEVSFSLSRSYRVGVSSFSSEYNETTPWISVSVLFHLGAVAHRPFLAVRSDLLGLYGSDQLENTYLYIQDSLSYR